MALQQTVYYSEEILTIKKNYYEHLPEKQARHFLGQEYLELGTGSQRYLSQVFGCSRHTIRKGAKELMQPNFVPDYTRQREEGGGRKKKKMK
jgi:hypothetical protein